MGATASIDGANVSMNAPVVTAADVLTSMTGVTTAGFTDFTTPRTIITRRRGRRRRHLRRRARDPAKLIVPANTLAGAYCTQATIAITSGP